MVMPLIKLVDPVRLVSSGIDVTPPPRATAGISEGRNTLGNPALMTPCPLICPEVRL
jgi:hypothetical protein